MKKERFNGDEWLKGRIKEMRKDRIKENAKVILSLTVMMVLFIIAISIHTGAIKFSH